MMDDQSEQWLIERAVAGETAAFARLVERNYAFIYRVAYKWSGDQTDAEDITHDVCLKLGQSIRSFKGVSAFSSWLYRITLNAVRDLQRTRARQAQKTAAMTLLAPLVDQPDPESDLTAKQLWIAVRKLPEKQRDAMLLVYGEDLTHREAADILGSAESTVSWNIREAKKKLKELI